MSLVVGLPAIKPLYRLNEYLEEFKLVVAGIHRIGIIARVRKKLTSINAKWH